jgi:hypothetical protein
MGLSAADVRVLSLGTGEAVMAVRPADGGLHSLLRAAVCVRQGRAAQARLAPGWAAAPLPRQRHLRRGRRFGAPGSGRIRPAQDVQVDVGDATVEHQRHDWCVPMKVDKQPQQPQTCGCCGCFSTVIPPSCGGTRVRVCGWRASSSPHVRPRSCRKFV